MKIDFKPVTIKLEIGIASAEQMGYVMECISDLKECEVK